MVHKWRSVGKSLRSPASLVTPQQGNQPFLLSLSDPANDGTGEAMVRQEQRWPFCSRAQSAPCGIIDTVMQLWTLSTRLDELLTKGVDRVMLLEINIQYCLAILMKEHDQLQEPEHTNFQIRILSENKMQKCVQGNADR